MRGEILLTIAIVILAAILLCLLQGINPLSLIQNQLSPYIQQLTEATQPYSEVPNQIVTALKENTVVQTGTIMGLTHTATGAISGYFYNKAKQKIGQLTNELKNHTSDNTKLQAKVSTAETQRDDVLTLASDLKDGYEAKLSAKDEVIADLERQLDAKQDEVDEAIEKRNAARRDLTQKTQDKIREDARVK